MNDATSFEFAADESVRQSLWCRYRHTPWRDLLRGRLSGTLEHRKVIAETDLPLSLKTTVNEVVARTRLLPRERQSVARELCDHFTDGLAAGRTPEQLAAEFGDPVTAARLIRRAKVRCRPWAGYLWHRLWLSLLCVGVSVVVVWTVMAIRYLNATPNVTYDLIANYDEQSRAVPESQRAWPYYRRGLVTINRDDLHVVRDDGSDFEVIDVLSEGPSNPHWVQASEYLATMDDTVGHFLEGAQHAELGFINRDPENEEWRRWDAHSGWESYNEAGTMGPMTLLAQAQDLRNVRAFLQGAMHVAVEKGNGSRAVELAIGLLHLADHGRQTHDGVIADLVSFGLLRPTLRQIMLLVLDHPELVTDEQLQQLSGEVARVWGGGRISFRMDAELRMWEDYLQYIYSDDGQGNGYITSEGLQEIIDSNQGPGRELLTYAHSEEQANWIKKLSATMAGTAIAAVIADRQTMHAKISELHALQREMLADIDTPPAVSDYVMELRRMSVDEPVRFLPLLAIIGDHVSNEQGQYAHARRLVAVNMERDAALIAIALEQHRRRTGNWPAALQELVPAELEQVPADLFSDGGLPVGYRLVNGKTQVYSVGPDHADDGGTPAADGPGWKSDTGDWVLLPPADKLD